MFSLRALSLPLRTLPLRPAVTVGTFGQSWRSFATTLIPMQGGDVQAGMTVEIKGKPYRVSKAYHVKPGKGGAFNQLSMVEITRGTKMDMRLRTDENVHRLSFDKPTPAQYMYTDGDIVHLMNSVTFEQFEVHKDTMGDNLPFIEDGNDIKLQFYNDLIIDVEMPSNAICKIVALDFLKHTSVATLENGVVIKVPKHLLVGDSVRLNIKDRLFLQKA